MEPTDQVADIFILINLGIKVASEKDKLILKAVLPHSYLRPDASILLIVKDIKEFKGKMV